MSGEPSHCYLTYLSPSNGKGRTIVTCVFEFIEVTPLQHHLAVIRTDGTASITGRRNGLVRSPEEQLWRPLQWSVSMLHLNEIPLRRVFMDLDGSTQRPDSFVNQCIHLAWYPFQKNL